MDLMQKNIKANMPCSKPRKVLCRGCHQECECAGWVFCSTCRVDADAETLEILGDHAGGWSITINRVGNPEWVRDNVV